MSNFCMHVQTKRWSWSHEIRLCVLSTLPLLAYSFWFQGLQYIEMFAGEANCWKAVSTAYPAARVDVNYDKAPPSCSKASMRQSPMDFLSSPGFATFDCMHWCTCTWPTDISIIACIPPVRVFEGIYICSSLFEHVSVFWRSVQLDLCDQSKTGRFFWSSWLFMPSCMFNNFQKAVLAHQLFWGYAFGLCCKLPNRSSTAS